MAATYIETGSRVPARLATAQVNWREKLSEYFWFSACLIMFMILGPFAAPIVLGFIFSKEARSIDMTEPDTVAERASFQETSS